MIGSAECSDLYAASPTPRFTYLEEFVKPDMLCLVSEDATQLCEVGDCGCPLHLQFSSIQCLLASFSFKGAKKLLLNHLHPQSNMACPPLLLFIFPSPQEVHESFLHPSIT